jgi:hypothetical protein
MVELVPARRWRRVFFRDPTLMSLPKPDLHVRLDPIAKAKLALLAEVAGVTETKLASQYLEEMILGKAHVLTVAARQLSRMGFDGMERD